MKLAVLTLLAVLILVKSASPEGFEYYEEEEDTEGLLCSSNEECLEMSPNKPICRQNNCQPECTPLAPCPIGQSCIDGRCNIESDVQDQPTGQRSFDYYEEEEEEEDIEELLCSSNKECLEKNPNKPICRENNCQPECTPLAPCPIGQSCIDGRCNIESDVQDQPTIINKDIQVNPAHLPIVEKTSAEKDLPQGSKRKADRNFKGETTTEAGDYYHTDDDDYNDEGTEYYNDEETSEGSDGTNSYNFYRFSTTDNLIISDQNIA